MRNARVTVITTSFPISSGSLSGIFVARLFGEIAKSIDVAVLTPGDSKGSATVRRGALTIIPCNYAPRAWQLLAHAPGGIPAAVGHSPWLKLLIPGLLLSLLWHCNRDSRSSDVLHANWAVCGCIAGIVGAVRDRPVVTTLRGEDVTRAARCWPDRFLLRLCAALSDKIICVSSDMRDWLTTRIPGAVGKTELIENGVDADFLTEGYLRTYVHPGGPVRIVTVGSLVPRKGVDQIIRALARTDGAVDATLTIVGSGPEDAALRALAAAENVDAKVRFAGSLPAEEVSHCLGRADVFVLASHSEGRPNAVLEAMATGLPVIASDISGIRELVRHGQSGLLFRDGDIDQLAACMIDLCGDAERRRTLGMRAHKEVIERGLTWERCAEKHLALYEQLRGGI